MSGADDYDDPFAGLSAAFGDTSDPPVSFDSFDFSQPTSPSAPKKSPLTLSFASSSPPSTTDTPPTLSSISPSPSPTSAPDAAVPAVASPLPVVETEASAFNGVAAKSQLEVINTDTQQRPLSPAALAPLSPISPVCLSPSSHVLNLTSTSVRSPPPASVLTSPTQSTVSTPATPPGGSSKFAGLSLGGSPRGSPRGSRPGSPTGGRRTMAVPPMSPLGSAGANRKAETYPADLPDLSESDEEVGGAGGAQPTKMLRAREGGGGGRMVKFDLAKGSGDKTVDQLEADLLFYQKRHEKDVARLKAERTTEITRMKNAFSEILAGVKDKWQAKYKDAAVVSQKLSKRNKQLKDRLTQYQQKIQSTSTNSGAVGVLLKDTQQARADLESTLAEERAQWKTTLAELQAKQTSLEEALAQKQTALTELQAKADRDALSSQLEAQINTGNAKGLACNGTSLSVSHNCQDPCEVLWLRSVKGSLFNPIPGGTGDTHTLTIDDVGAVLKAQCSEIDSGLSVAAEVGPIFAQESMVIKLADALRKNEIELPVQAVYPQTKAKKHSVLLGKSKLKCKEGSKTTAKGVYSKDVQLELLPETPDCFSISGFDSGKPLILRSSDRDLTVACIRIFTAFRVRGHHNDHHLAVRQMLRVLNEGTSAHLTADAGTLRRHSVSAITSLQRSSARSVNSRPTAASLSRGSTVGKSEADRSQPANNGLESLEIKEIAQKRELKYDKDGFVVRDEEADKRQWDEGTKETGMWDSDDDDDANEKKVFKGVAIRSVDDPGSPKPVVSSLPSKEQGNGDLTAKPKSPSTKERKSKKKKKKRKPTIDQGHTSALDDDFDFGDADSVFGDQTLTSPGASAPASAAVSDTVAVAETAAPVASTMVADAEVGKNLDMGTIDERERACAGVIDAVICESIHVSIKGGEVMDYAVRGEVVLHMHPPPKEKSVFHFSLSNVDAFKSAVPNRTCLYNPIPGIYGAVLQPGQTSVSIFEYKVKTTVAEAKHTVPIAIRITTTSAIETELAVDVNYAVSAVHGPLSNVKVMLGVGPTDVVDTCAFAQPKCLWNPKTQKVLWKMPVLPLPSQPDQAIQSGKLQVRLATRLKAQTLPLSVSFLCEQPGRVISGLTLAAAQPTSGAKDLPQYQLREALLLLKSGRFTAE